MIEDITYYTHNRFGPQRGIERHEIRFHELTFLLEGRMNYYINDEKFPMLSGDIIYVPAGGIRQREMGDVPNDYISINFHSVERLPLKPLSGNGVNDEVRLLLQYLDKVYEAPSMINQKKMGHVLEALILQIADNLSLNSVPPLASEIVAYLSRHFRERVTLEDISRETYFSTAYCESEFRKHMGSSIIQYLIDLRIVEAKKLLKETSMACSAIAAAVGFEDANYFSRIFKKRTGYSPLQYRAFVG